MTKIIVFNKNWEVKKNKINFLKLVIGLTIFRRWRAVHGAEERPSPSGFAMVIQKAPSTPSNKSCKQKNVNITPPTDDGSRIKKLVIDIWDMFPLYFSFIYNINGVVCCSEYLLVELNLNKTLQAIDPSHNRIFYTFSALCIPVPFLFWLYIVSVLRYLFWENLYLFPCRKRDIVFHFWTVVFVSKQKPRLNKFIDSFFFTVV